MDLADVSQRVIHLAIHLPRLSRITLPIGVPVELLLALLPQRTPRLPPTNVALPVSSPTNHPLLQTQKTTGLSAASLNLASPPMQALQVLVLAVYEADPIWALQRTLPVPRTMTTGGVPVVSHAAVLLVRSHLTPLVSLRSPRNPASNSTPPTPQMSRRKLELLPRSSAPSAVPSPLSSPNPSNPPAPRANPFGAAKWVLIILFSSLYRN